MASQNRRSGFDILNIFFQYDYHTDILHVGVDCDGICGDADGDGNPSDGEEGFDPADFCYTEQLSLMLWPNPPETWVPSIDFTWFFPTMVVGVDSASCIDSFGAYTFAESDTCPFQLALDKKAGISNNPCVARQQGRVTNPGSDGYGFNLTELVCNNNNKQLPK